MTSRSFSKSRLDRMRSIMNGYVERGDIPGIVTLVSRRSETHVDATGVQDLVADVPMQRDTIFRIASMTKPITAVAAMILVEECKLRLDDPVDPWLPELADRKVLRSLDSQIDDTILANRPIILRDLLTFRLGFGAVIAPPDQYPIQRAIAEAGFAPGPKPPTHTPNEWIRRFGKLPLLHQPGERWMYHTGSDVLGVLIARASGMGFEEFLRERIFLPLGMKDTGFSVPKAKLDRLATCYQLDAATGTLVVYDESRDGLWSRPPEFPSGAGGLVSTADDYLAFGQMMLNFGRHGMHRVLARPTVELMTSDQVTQAQKAASPFFPGFWDYDGWGFGLSVVTRRDGLAPSPGSFGWAGGFSTYWYSDPHEEMVAILLIQRLMQGPSPASIDTDFWTLAYAAIDD